MVLLFASAVSLAFLTKPFHMDEAFFLAVARNILHQPLHPLSFMYNWWGTPLPAWSMNSNSLILPYMLAAALRVTGGGEVLMRLCFVPFDLAAAAALYLLACRFLSRPLGPTIIALATPAYLINMNLLMPEKILAFVAFSGLYALVRGAQEERRDWYFASAILLGCAMALKYYAVFLFLPALCYSFHMRVPPRRIASYLLIAMAPIALYFAVDGLLGWIMTHAALAVIRPSSDGGWSRWPHKTRSILAFCGGGGLVTAFWPYLVLKKREFPALASAFAVVFFIFLPTWDAISVRSVDRLTGILFSAGTLLGFLRLAWFMDRGRGWALWSGWTLGGLLLLILYPSVVTRLVAFTIPPLIFASAEALESGWSSRRLERLYAASFCGVMAISIAAAAVDHRYAAAQKEVAEEVRRMYIAKGAKVWFTGHWGLQYYLEQAGAVALDRRRGGWDQAKPGEVVVSPLVNAEIIRPGKPLRSNVRTLQADSAVPLRLMSAGGCQGGFYTSVWGFLPFCLSLEPVDTFSIVELIP